jgi:hypothetical protein
VIGSQSGDPVIEQRLAGAHSTERISYEPIPPQDEADEVLPVRVR